MSSPRNTPSPKRLNQKPTPPTNSDMPTRKFTRNRQSTLANALGDPVPINTINMRNREVKTTLRFEIDFPTDKPETCSKPSLKSLKQEMGFTYKTSEYEACVNFLESICPKNKKKTSSRSCCFNCPRYGQPK